MADRGLCTREEIPAEAKWAIEDLYKNDDEWEADFTRLKERLPELSAYPSWIIKFYDITFL